LVHFGRVKTHGVFVWLKFEEPNQFGSYIVLMTPLLFSVFIRQRHLVAKTFSALCMIACVACLFATGSRGGMLAFGVMLLIYVYLIYKRQILGHFRLILAMAILLIVGFGSFLILPKNLQDRTFDRVIHRGATQDLDAYSSGRIENWVIASKFFLKRPILGYGLNGYHSLARQNHKIPAADTHNMYLKYLLDHGLIGLFVYILFLLSCIWTARSQLSRADDFYGRMLYISFVSGFCAYCIATFFVNIYTLQSLVYAYVAVVHKYGHLQQQEEKMNSAF